MPSTRRWTKQKWIDKKRADVSQSTPARLKAPAPCHEGGGFSDVPNVKKRQIALPSYPTKEYVFSPFLLKRAQSEINANGEVNVSVRQIILLFLFLKN